jgi:hypothetical protein
LVVIEADLERTDHQAVATPNARVFLAYLGGEAVGLATCFIGFSTFHGRPLVNVHASKPRCSCDAAAPHQ